MKYHGKFGRKIGRIKHIALMSRIDLCYETCRISTQTVAPTLSSFPGINRCVQYLDIHPHKPIFYLSNSYGGSNLIRLTWSGNQVEYHTTIIVWNFIKMRIMTEFSTEDGQYRVLYIICLVLLSAGKYRFNQL